MVEDVSKCRLQFQKQTIKLIYIQKKIRKFLDEIDWNYLN